MKIVIIVIMNIVTNFIIFKVIILYVHTNMTPPTPPTERKGVGLVPSIFGVVLDLSTTITY